MFRRPPLSHPYKPSGPFSAAGFRFGDYVPRRCFNLFQGPNFTNTRSPDPSPLSSPVRGVCHLEDEAPPTIRLADLLAGDGLGSPQRPSSPTPDSRQNATPNVANANDPLLNLPRRKRKGPKHLSFRKDAHRPGVVPPHRRSQQLKDKRDAIRKRLLGSHERRVAQARDEISRLRREAEALMTPEHMNDEDHIFLKQLGNLQFDQRLKHDLEACRERMARAAAEMEERRKQHEERDKEAAKLWEAISDEEAQEEQKRKVDEFVRGIEDTRKAHHRRVEEKAMHADEERQRAYQATERKIREEQERLFHEALRRAKEREEYQRRLEQERRLCEERKQREQEAREYRLREQERMLREEIARARRMESERRQREEQERQLREEIERLRREAEEHFLRKQRERFDQEREQERQARVRREAEEQFPRKQRERLAREEQERQVKAESERQARLRAEQARRIAQDNQTRQHLALYEAKWNELRTSNSIPPIDVQEMPWPVFGVISSADQITYQGVRTFLFHPLRPGVEGKTARDKVKSEVLRFHPDKFNTRIIPKIESSQQAVAQEIAGAVARILTTIMTEQGEQ